MNRSHALSQTAVAAGYFLPSGVPENYASAAYAASASHAV